MRAPHLMFIAAVGIGGGACLVEEHPAWQSSDGTGSDATSATGSGSTSNPGTGTSVSDGSTGDDGSTTSTSGVTAGSGSTGSASSGPTASGGSTSGSSGGGSTGGTGSCAAVTAWEFMACPDGWTVEKAVPEAEGAPTWACGDPTSGPGAAGHPGQFATNLAGAYGSRESSALISPSIDLSGCSGSGVRMEMDHWWDFEGGGGNNDGSIIEVSPDGGMSWSYVTPDVGGYFMGVVIDASYPPVDQQFGFSSSNGGNPMTWTHTEVDLEPFAGQSDVRIRLVFGSDPLVQRDGWYVDRVAITTP